MSNGAMAAAFMKWAPSPQLCMFNVPFARPLSPPSIFFPSQQHAVRCMAGPRSNISAHAQPLTKLKRKQMDKDSTIADEHVLQLGYEDSGVETGRVDDEDAKIRMRNEQIRRADLREKLSRVLSNAQRLKEGTSRYPCFSLGIDFGDVRTGVAISKGFAPRPIEVVEMQGQRLEARLIEIAHKEGAIEFVVGLPKSSKGMETSQSYKTRCFAGRLAVLAAQRGWRVYLHDEFGTSNDALEYMITMGSTKKSRKTRLDAYAAVILLQVYFDSSGENAELVVPKKLSLQERLCEAPISPESDDDDNDFGDEQF